MGEKEEEIFSTEFEDKQKKEGVTEFPPIPNAEDDSPPNIPPDSMDDDNDEPKKEKTSNGSRRKYGILGAIIIGLIVGGSAYGIQTGIIGESEPFDPTGCHYGVTSNFMGQRCLTQEEFEEAQKVEETKDNMNPIEIGESIDKPAEKPSSGGGTKDVSSTADKVELEKTNDILGYYVVTSNGDWYGDYVDFRKVPSKIEESGSMKVNFRCYKDDFAGTSTYFATFRNVIEPNLTVEVYINGLKVETQSTDKNRAIIVEGTCLQ